MRSVCASPVVARPSAVATAAATWPGSTATSSTTVAGRPRRRLSSGSVSATSRVLPIPPAPVMVTRRCARTIPISRADSSSRPTNTPARAAHDGEARTRDGNAMSGRSWLRMRTSIACSDGEGSSPRSSASCVR